MKRHLRCSLLYSFAKFLCEIGWLLCCRGIHRLLGCPRTHGMWNFGILEVCLEFQLFLTALKVRHFRRTLRRLRPQVRPKFFGVHFPTLVVHLSRGSTAWLESIHLHAPIYQTCPRRHIVLVRVQCIRLHKQKTDGVTRVGDTRGDNWRCRPYFFWKKLTTFCSHSRLQRDDLF